MRGERWEVLALALGEAARAFRAACTRLARPARTARPRRLLFAPQDLRTADPTIAIDIYGGRFVFAGRSVSTAGRSPFEIPVPSHDWAEAFYGFAWLRHLSAAGTGIATANARVLVADFLARPPGRPSIAWRAPVVARRLISFLVHSSLLIEQSDPASSQRLLRAIARSTALLEPAAAADSVPLTRLRAAIALAYAGLACSGYDEVLRRAVKSLASELDRQILPDGGHVGRNAEVLIELVLDLVPLRQAFSTRGIEPPQALIRAIDRIGPLLRLLRHGDGSLTYANGVGLTPIDHLATALAQAESRGEVTRRAPHAGYERLEAGTTLIVIDLGSAPPLRSSGAAHAGCLAFELSSGAQRLVVNCGAPNGRAARLRLASRETAAHSTATLADASSARFLRIEGVGPERQIRRWLTRRLGAVILEGPQAPLVERGGEAGLRVVGARHDGYRREGFTHVRTWRLADDGASLAGADRFEDDGAARAGGMPEAVIRFHLHPGVAASPDEAPASADAPEGTANASGEHGFLLRLPDGETWRFDATGGVSTIEESVFFATTEGARSNHQIVVRAAAANLVTWLFSKLPPAPVASRETDP